MKKSSFRGQNFLLAIAVITLAIIPLIFIKGKYQGADDQAKGVIAEINPEYKPWFQPLFTPPSSQIESLLFASQAAIGAGIIGYAIGFYKGRKKDK